MKAFIEKKLSILIAGPFGYVISLILAASAAILAMWVMCLLITIIGWPFMYVIDKIVG